MMSKRLSIQWPPEEASENTETMVVYSKDDHFVDIRVFKTSYPTINENPDLETFKNTFEWTMTGDEISLEPELPDTYVLQFTHEIDSLAIMKSIETKTPLEQCANDPDMGTFWKVPGSQDRKETGHMVNPATGKDQEYVEYWRSLSSSKTTPEFEVRELPEDVENDDKMFVLRVNLDVYHGQVIRTGNWCQGLLHNKKNLSIPLNVVRAYFDGTKWHYLIKFGNVDLPLEFNGKKGETIVYKDITWECIE